MKRTLPIALIAAGALALGLTGCGSSGSAADDGTLTVGVFLPGSVNDTGFMQSAYAGVDRVREEYGDQVEISYVEQVSAADYQQALQRFASENELVISVGGQTDADLRKVAPQFPDVTFVEIGGPADAEPMENLAYYDPQQAEAEFVAGAAAATSSTAGTIGFVGGVELPAIVNSAIAFENGAEFARPGVRVLAPQYVGDFNDPAKAKQAAAAAYAGGADVLSQVVNLGKQGMEQAAQETGNRMSGGPIPGDCTNPVYTGYVKTDIGTEVEYAVTSVLDGTWEAAQVPFGLTTDKEGTDYVVCSTDPAVTQAVERAKSAIADGSVAPY
ncbi:BMP family ABC transporter substrate-binding protein [Gordonia sp. PKS22-38]|uniref:BMP family ABC transporter substrate-binding protein n=1 Tax=Gordonia prachuapensis TaxID=3115651 RepID=A0ABU7MXE1_9ACTN|nr:BMP family ABC transporter substrate-binding protein [Gordonia sp. PKS22-38]